MYNQPHPIFLSKQLESVKGVIFASVNICSIIRKIDDVLIILNNSNLEYLGITESWLSESTADCELTCDQYNIFRSDHEGALVKDGGGGIIVYTKAERDFENLVEWKICTSDVECIWSKLIPPKTHPTFTGCCYRPPSGNIDNFLEYLEMKIIEIYDEGVSDILILGDINIDYSSRHPNRTNYDNCIKALGLD